MTTPLKAIGVDRKVFLARSVLSASVQVAVLSGAFRFTIPPSIVSGTKMKSGKGGSVRQDYYQHAYVTTDWRRAMDEIAKIHGIAHYMEMPAAVFDTGQDRQAVAHFALATKDELQFEIIQPLSGDIEVYQWGLPTNGFALHFHHQGRHFGDRDAFDGAIAVAKGRWAMPIAWDTMGGTYAYFDARADLGHFMEYFCFPPGSHLEAVPRF